MAGLKPLDLHGSGERASVLRLVFSAEETSAPYQQFTKPGRNRHHTTLCSFFPIKNVLEPGIRLISGNGSMRGYLSALRCAFAAGPYDVIHCHFPQLAVLFFLRTMFRRSDLPHAVLTLHCEYRNYSRVARWLLPLISRRFSSIVIVSHSASATYPKWLKCWAGHRWQVIQNGVNIDRVDEQAPTSIGILPMKESNRSQVVVAVIGRLIESKNPLTMLEAIAHCGCLRTEIHFYGEGSLREKIQAEAAKRGISERVHMHGVVPRDMLFRRIHNVDIVASASRSEGLPVAILEAMACRVPVVLSDIPSHREIVADADFIPLVPVDDVQGFADEISRVARMDRETRAYLGHRCRELVERRFNLTSMLSAYDALFDEVMGMKKCA